VHAEAAEGGGGLAGGGEVLGVVEIRRFFEDGFEAGHRLEELLVGDEAHAALLEVVVRGEEALVVGVLEPVCVGAGVGEGVGTGERVGSHAERGGTRRRGRGGGVGVVVRVEHAGLYPWPTDHWCAHIGG
jgi:hypothetical protein